MSLEVQQASAQCENKRYSSSACVRHTDRQRLSVQQQTQLSAQCTTEQLSTQQNSATIACRLHCGQLCHTYLHELAWKRSFDFFDVHAVFARCGANLKSTLLAACNTTTDNSATSCATVVSPHHGAIHCTTLVCAVVSVASSVSACVTVHESVFCVTAASNSSLTQEHAHSTPSHCVPLLLNQHV